MRACHLALLFLAIALPATTPANAAPPPQRDGGWSAGGGGESRAARRARRAREDMLDRAEADRAVPERDARSRAAESSADAQARCAAVVQRRLAEGREQAAKRKQASCRRRHGGEPRAQAR